MLDDLLTTLDVLWAAWKRQGEALTDAQWDRPTWLGTRDVQSLYAHAAAWPLGFSKLLGRVHDVEPTHPTAAALLRDFNRPTGSPSAEPTRSPPEHAKTRPPTAPRR